MSKESEHVTVKIPRELIEQMDRLKGKYGFRSRGEIAKEAIRRLLAEYELKPPRFEQINSSENGVKILDRELHKVVEVYIHPKGLKCEVDHTDKCEHVKFVLSLRDVQEIIKKRIKEGWKLPEV